eukprot:g8923.t1
MSTGNLGEFKNCIEKMNGVYVRDNACKEREAIKYSADLEQLQLENLPPYELEKIVDAQYYRTQALHEKDYNLHKDSGCQYVMEEESVRLINQEEKQEEMVNLTYENLNNSSFTSSFPLITGSACTHSLTTPSIGTMTSEEYDIVEDLTPYIKSTSMGLTETKSSINCLVKSVANEEVFGKCNEAIKSEMCVKEEDKKAEMEFAPYRLFRPNALTIAVQFWLKHFEAEIKAK